MPKIFIDDGYTLTATVQPPGLPPLKIQYRYSMPDATFEYLAGVRLGGKAQYQATIALLANQVLGWDAVGEDNSPAPVDAKTLARVPVDYLIAMANIVTSYTPEQQRNDAKN